MGKMEQPQAGGSAVRDDFIPKEHYTSVEVAEAERLKLWPHVWQMACREEEIPRVGDFRPYEVAGQSILVVRSAGDQIRAFHNVCPHRGMQVQVLAERDGNAKIRCMFHGWEWSLDGRNTYVKDHGDWAGCEHMSSEDLGLTEVRVGRWGGFVFINMDPQAESFEDFIDPVPKYLDCLEFGKMRFQWYKTMLLKGNWKTAMESFMESYHVFTTHPQTTDFLDEISVSFVHGKHGKHGYPNARPTGAPSARTGKPMPADMREGFVTAIEQLALTTGGAKDRIGCASARSADALRKRMFTEVAAGASALDVLIKGMQIMQEAAEADGAGWPTVTPEQAAELGVDWNVFPNMVLVFSFDCTLVFRARPNGDDPHSCIFDMWALYRCAPDKAPAFEREHYADWRQNAAKIPSLLVQDLTNIERIQRGMQSIAFKGSRTNPIQERQISNHHKHLAQYLHRNS